MVLRNVPIEIFLIGPRGGGVNSIGTMSFNLQVFFF